MKINTSSIITAVVILICLIVIFLFFYFFEIAEERVYTGFKGEARTNPFFASQQLLKKRGIKFKNIYSEYQLDNFPANGTIFLLTDLKDFSDEVLRNLLDWVEDGGNLTICVSHPYNDNLNPILDYFNINIEVSENNEMEYFTFSLPNYEHSIDVELDNEINFIYQSAYPPLLHIKTPEHTLFIQFKLKDGFISFTGSPVFMNNRNIGKYNNIQFFYYCAHVNKVRDYVWYVVRNTKLSFFELLWKYGWIGIISLIIFVIFVIWRYSMRFGPVIEETNKTRRSLIEHVHASGRFLWDNNHGIILIKALEKTIKWKILYKNPKWNNLSEIEKGEWLYTMCGVRIKGFNEYFGIILHNHPANYDHIKIRQKDFFRIIKILRRIQKTL